MQKICIDPAVRQAPTLGTDYLHTRENPCGPARELWHHGDGCGAWLIVTRNTLTHEMIDCTLVQKVRA